MCLAYTIADADAATRKVEQYARQARAGVAAPRWRIRPTDPAAVITGGDPRDAADMSWGWRGQWGGPDARPGVLTCARSETLLQKPAFKAAVNERRAVMIATGFFELRLRKWPHLFRVSDRPAFAMAALWRPATAAAPATCVLVTTSPNDVMAPIHNRMPVVLDDEAAETWLGGATLDEPHLAELCRPFDAGRMTQHAVDPSLLTKGFVDGPASVAPWTPAQAELF